MRVDLRRWRNAVGAGVVAAGAIAGAAWGLPNSAPGGRHRRSDGAAVDTGGRPARWAFPCSRDPHSTRSTNSGHSIWALLLTGLNFNISAGVGFIAILGVGMMNGLIVLSTINHLRAKGAAVEGSS